MNLAIEEKTEILKQNEEKFRQFEMEFYKWNGVINGYKEYEKDLEKIYGKFYPTLLAVENFEIAKKELRRIKSFLPSIVENINLLEKEIEELRKIFNILEGPNPLAKKRRQQILDKINKGE